MFNFRRKKEIPQEDNKPLTAMEASHLYLTRTQADALAVDSLVGALSLTDVHSEIGFSEQYTPTIQGKDREILIKKIIEISERM